MFKTLKHYLFYFRSWILIQAVETGKKYYGRWVHPSRKPWKYTIEQLLEFPEGTLGRALAGFLQNKGLKLVPLHESHDIYHILTGYRTNLYDEAMMQFFLLGARKYTTSVFLSAGIAILILPDYFPAFIRHYQRGRRCRPVGRWQFEFLLGEQVEVLRQLMYGEESQADRFIV